MSDRKYARFGGGTANVNENNHIAKKNKKTREIKWQINFTKKFF